MFDYRCSRFGDRVVFYLVGDLSLEETATLRQAFYEAITSEALSALVLDLSEVETLDSSTLSLFVATKNTLKRKGARLVLVGMSPAIARRFERTNLHLYFEMYDTLEEAPA